MGFFDKLKKGLEKTRKGISEKVDQVLTSFGKIDEDLFEELEEILIASDVGVETTLKIVENIKSEVKERKISDPIAIKELLKEELIAILNSGNEKDDLDECSVLKLDTSPAVIVVVGVNGVGKTTSIGKITANLKNRGRR